MYNFKTLLVSLLLVALANSAPTALDKNSDTAKPKTKNENSTTSDDESVDNRFNLNFADSDAYATDDEGRYSGVKASSWGLQAGILNQNTNEYDELGSSSGGHSEHYSSGDGAPKTWAGASSKTGIANATGSATAGYLGGKGSTHSNSHSETEAIDMGDGFVFLTNLDTGKDEKSNSTNVSKEKEKTEKPTQEKSVNKITAEKPVVDNKNNATAHAHTQEKPNSSKNTAEVKPKKTESDNKSNKPKIDPSKDVISFPGN